MNHFDGCTAVVRPPTQLSTALAMANGWGYNGVVEGSALFSRGGNTLALQSRILPTYALRPLCGVALDKQAKLTWGVSI